MATFRVKRNRAAQSTGWDGRITKRAHCVADISSVCDGCSSIETERRRTQSAEVIVGKPPSPQEALVKLEELAQLVASQNDLITRLGEAVALLTLEVHGRTTNRCECPSYIT